MYHLFGGGYYGRTSMDDYDGAYETLEQAGAQVLKKRWEWADVALLKNGKLEKVATWKKRQIADHDTAPTVTQTGWLMSDGMFIVITSEEFKYSPIGGAFLSKKWASAENMMCGSAWPEFFVFCESDDDQDDE
jgi:hypothetical protein